jgi:hypothetical protein
MASSVSGLHGGGRASTTFSIGGEVPTSTKLAMVEESHGELQLHAFTTRGRVCHPRVWAGCGPKCQVKALLGLANVGNVDIFGCRFPY